MPILGSQPASFTGWIESGLNTNNVIATPSSYTMPATGGYLTAISLYLSGYTTTPNVIATVWAYPSPYDIIAASGISVIPQGSETVNRQGWQTFFMPYNLLAANQVFSIGGWRDPSQDWIIGTVAGTSYQQTTPGSTGPPNPFAGSAVSGLMGAYITYSVTPLTRPHHTQNNQARLALLRWWEHPHG